MDLEAPLTIPAGKDIVIQLLGDSEIGKSKKNGAAEGAVIESDGPVDSLFTIGYGADVTLENITLIGENTANNSLIFIENLEDKTKDMTTKLTLINVNTLDYADAEEPLYGSAIAASQTGKIEIEGGSYTSEIFCLVTYPQASSTAKATITCTGAALDHNAYPCPAAGVFLYEVFHLIDIGTVPVLSLMPNKSRKIWLKKIQKN